MGRFSLVYEILTRPTIGIRRQKETKPILFPIFIALLSTFSMAIAQNLFLSFGLLNLIIECISSAIFIIIVLLLGASILHFVCECGNGEGKATTLFLVLCLSLLPCIFATPLALIIRTIGSLPLRIFLILLSGISIMLWVTVLQILGLKENYQFSMLRAAILYTIPGIITFVVLFFFFLILLFRLIISAISGS